MRLRMSQSRRSVNCRLFVAHSPAVVEMWSKCGCVEEYSVKEGVGRALLLTPGCPIDLNSAGCTAHRLWAELVGK